MRVFFAVAGIRTAIFFPLTLAVVSSTCSGGLTTVSAFTSFSSSSTTTVSRGRGRRLGGFPVSFAFQSENEYGNNNKDDNDDDGGRFVSVAVDSRDNHYEQESVIEKMMNSVLTNAGASLIQVTAIVAFAVSLSLAHVEPANAVLGAGGAVVSSPTVVKTVTLDEFLALPEKKQRQYEGGFLACKYDTSLSFLNNNNRESISNSDNNDINNSDKTSTASPIRKITPKRKKTPRKILCRPTNLGDELLKEIDALSEIDPDRADQFKQVAQNLVARQLLLDRQKVVAQLAQQPEFVYFGCAFFASVFSTSIMHPLDTLKVRIINNSKDEDGNEMDVKAALLRNPLAFAGSLYDGLLFNVLKEAPPCALYLGVYEYVRAYLVTVPSIEDNALLVYLLAGSVGEFVGSVLRAPFEAVKVRVQTGMFDVTGAIKNVFLTDDGRANTVKAWSAGIFRDVPHGAILISFFELTKTFIVDSSIDVDVNTLLAEAVLGGIGGGLGAFIVTPFDVVTTKIIVSLKQNRDTPNLIQATQEAWEDGGLKALFTGVNERIIYWAFSYGIFLSVYCSLRQKALLFF